MKRFPVGTSGLDTLLVETFINPIDSQPYIVGYSEVYAVGDYYDVPKVNLVAVCAYVEIPHNIETDDPFIEKFFWVLKKGEFV